MSPADTATAAATNAESRTTVLPPGAVEARNYSSSRQISAEIRAFLDGTDGNGATLGPRSEFRTFFTVWMFLTRLPSPSWIDLHPGFLMRGESLVCKSICSHLVRTNLTSRFNHVARNSPAGMCYFPVAGSIIGLGYAVVFDFLDVSIGLPSTVSAAVAIGVGLYLTGCFHEDGLADSADGLGGGWSKSQALKIMTDSRVGTFGCAALSLFLFAKLQLMASLGTSQWEVGLQSDGAKSSGAGPAILVAQMVSRLTAPYLIRTRDYVAEVGPKSPFYLFMIEAKYLVTWPRFLLAAAYCFGVSAALYRPVFASVIIAAALLLAHLAGNKGDYLLGGVMGDFLGATICISEIWVLVLICAKESLVDLYRVATDALQSSDSTNPSQLVVEMYQSDRLRPVFHFALLAAAAKIWCSFVGPADMYDREDKKSTEGAGKKGD